VAYSLFGDRFVTAGRGPLDSERIAGDLLVFDQGRGASVHRAQRGQIRGQQRQIARSSAATKRRHDPNRIEEPAAHAQKAQLQGVKRSESANPGKQKCQSLSGVLKTVGYRDCQW
jgi:hypothetical protein